MAFYQNLTFLGNFNGSVADNGQVFINPPRTGKYAAFYIKAIPASGKTSTDLTNAVMASAVTEVRASCNGNQRIKFPTWGFHDVYKSRTGATCPNGIIPLLLCNDKYTTYGQKQVGAWGMGGINSFDITLMLGAGVTTNISAFELYADQSPTTEQAGMWQGYTYQTDTAPKEGAYDITTLQTFGADTLVQAIHVTHDTTDGKLATFSSQEVMVNGVVVVRNNIPEDIFAISETAFGNYPTEVKGNVIRFDAGDDPNMCLVMANVNQLRYRADISGTNTAAVPVTFLYEALRGFTSK